MAQQKKLLSLLQRGSTTPLCSGYLHHLPELDRLAIYHELESSRLHNKYGVMNSQHQVEDLDWAQIAFNNIAHYLGDMHNRKSYIALAQRIDLKILQRERESQDALESLLIATSGLLHTLPACDATREIIEEGEYMLHKYDITPLKRSQWSGRNVNYNISPIVRLSQLAQIIHRNESLLYKILNCRSRSDVFNLLNVSCSPRIVRYFGGVTRHLEATASDIIAINAIVPLMFSYGHFTDDDILIAASIDLNEALPAEDNGIVRKWRKMGLTPASAYQTQAIIEVNNNYCKKQRCNECPLYHHMTSPKSIISSLPALFPEF